MSKQLNRQYLRVNNRRGVIQSFPYNTDIGEKSVAKSGIVQWKGYGRGLQGESVNSKTNSGKTQLIKNRKPT